MKHLSVVVLGASLALVPATSFAWRAVNLLEVFPAGNGAFEVVSRPGSGASNFWCAAGDYALRQLGAAAAQRIYIVKPSSRSSQYGGKATVQFSLSPPASGAADPGYSLSVKVMGDNLTAAFAQQYCHDFDADKGSMIRRR